MKLIRYDDESSELFNLNTDPGETSPLSLSVPANKQIADELEADAIAEDVTRGSVQYRTWSGPNGGTLHTASNWSAPTSPDRYWSAAVVNNANDAVSPAIAHVTTDVTTLGVEIRGKSSLQVVEVHPGQTLTGSTRFASVRMVESIWMVARWPVVAGSTCVPKARSSGRAPSRATSITRALYRPGGRTIRRACRPQHCPTLAPSTLNTGVATVADI